jgi:hypothetical protein
MESVNVVSKFRNESVNGIPISVLKSAIQKYARRGLLEDGYRALGLLSFFTEARITTNITNRLVVMMSEEVNIHETFLPVAMKELHEEYARTRSAGVWLRMYALICRARKCRVVSDVKTRWNLPPYKKNVARLDRLHQRLLEEGDHDHHGDGGQAEATPGTVEDFRARLQAGSHDVFDVLRVLLRGKPFEKAIWEAILGVCQDALQPPIAALRYFHKQMHHAERPIYIYHAVLLVLNAAALDYTTPLRYANADGGDLERWRREAVETLTADSFPDYVIDRHTTLARGQSAVVFAEVGAMIPDEDTRFLDAEHRRLYKAFKVMQEEEA